MHTVELLAQTIPKSHCTRKNETLEILLSAKTSLNPAINLRYQQRIRFNFTNNTCHGLVDEFPSLFLQLQKQVMNTEEKPNQYSVEAGGTHRDSLSNLLCSAAQSLIQKALIKFT